MIIKSRTDAVEFVHRVKELVPGRVMRIHTPLGNVLVVRCGEHRWTRSIITPSGDCIHLEEEIRSPAGWVYANRRMVNKWLRHVEAGGAPDAVAE